MSRGLSAYDTRSALPSLRIEREVKVFSSEVYIFKWCRANHPSTFTIIRYQSGRVNNRAMPGNRTSVNYKSTMLSGETPYDHNSGIAPRKALGRHRDDEAMPRTRWSSQASVRTAVLPTFFVRRLH
jgi:hypothetical protein